MTICPKCDGKGVINGIQKQTMSSYTITCGRCAGTGKGDLIFYAGIGSRETPIQVCNEMSNIAMQLALRGICLRTGRAKQPAKPAPDTFSADLAFENGCAMVGGKRIIRTANSSDYALAHAAQFHPNWSACDEYARGLHARNSLIMCGDDFASPVNFVVCWTLRGEVRGGTGQALRIAQLLQIPVFNFGVSPIERFWSWIDDQV